MITFLEQKRPSFVYRLLSSFIVFTFIFSSIVPPTPVLAQFSPQTVLNLPIPGTMLNVTSSFQPALIKGIMTHPDNPLEFDFIVVQGDNQLSGEVFNEEARNMIKYFLAALTTPEDEMWVNLSPYEGNRIIPAGLGTTEMGRDLLAQDYILKQLTASLMYPEDKLGGEFWKRVHKKALALYGTTEIPMNTFNKIWIVPDSAIVYQKGSNAFVIENKLKVMLEEDYNALNANIGNKQFGADQVNKDEAKIISGVTSEIVREVLIPEIQYEVNHGQHFSKLRQIANAMVLATWYKQNLKESLLGHVYVDQNKTVGIDVDDKAIKDRIYEQYIEAFQKGVYNYIKEYYDPTTEELIPRKYFSGGFDGDWTAATQTFVEGRDTVPERVQGLIQQEFGEQEGDKAVLSVKIDLIDAGPAADATTIDQVVSAAEKNTVDLTLGQDRVSLIPKQQTSDNATLGSIQFDELARGLAEFDKSYMAGLYAKFVALQSGQSQQKPLVIGQNFKPSALLRSDELSALLGARVYVADISGNADYIEAAKTVVLIANPMNGGLGSSVSRKTYLEQVAGRSELGAKGTDLFFDVTVQGFNADGSARETVEQISVTELKYIQALRAAGKYSNIIVQELVNEDSVGPMNKFLDETIYLFDRIDQRPGAPKRTYRQIIQETEGIELASTMIMQGALPVIDAAKNELTFDYSAPGGHGQLGSMVLQEALTADLPEGVVVIRAVFNGDGPNNTISEDIAGFMARERIPIVMISTTKTSLDKKGGLIGVEEMDNGKIKTQMLELAQAKSNKQEALFTAMGLTEGEQGGQYFNTNIAAVNYTALQPFLRELKEIIGENAFNEIVTPDLIPNEKKKGERRIVQLEGAMGSALLNLNGFVTTTENPQVQALMQKYGFARLLTVVNTDETSRTKFFTPIKFAYDFVLYAQTDHFGVDIESGALVNLKPGHLPGFGTMDDYYADVLNSVNAFRGTSMVDLEEINIVGRVNMPGAVLRGRVAINNLSEGVVDLTGFAGQIGVNQQGRLLLDNVFVQIGRTGQLERVQPIDQVDLATALQRSDNAILPTVPERLLEQELATKISIGTSGWRAKIGEFNLNNVARLIAASANVMQGLIDKEAYTPVSKTILKIGLTFGGREMGREAAIRAAEVLTAVGGIEVYLGEDITTTPAAIALTRPELGLDALDLVFHFDASHNAVDYNGVKIFANGVVAPDSLTELFAAEANRQDVYAAYDRTDYTQSEVQAAIKSTQPLVLALRRYQETFPGFVDLVQNYLTQHPEVQVTIDTMHGASGAFVEAAFAGLPVSVIRTNPMRSTEAPRQWESVNPQTGETVRETYKPEPIQKFLDKEAFQNFEANAADGSLYLAIDGDSDRLAIWAKSEGRLVEMLPNDLGILFGSYLLSSGRTQGATKVVKTLPTTFGLMALARANGLEEVETPVGSKWFAPYMEDLLIATEESGHQVIRIGNDVFFDDAVVQAQLLFEIMAREGKSPVTALQDAKRSIAGYSAGWVYYRNDVPLTETISDNIKGPLGVQDAGQVRQNIQTLVGQMQAQVGEAASKIEITISNGQVVDLNNFMNDQFLKMKLGDGLKFSYTDGSWVQFRLSGTEPLVRIYAEGPTGQRRAQLNDALGETLSIPSELYQDQVDRAVLSTAERLVNDDDFQEAVDAIQLESRALVVNEETLAGINPDVRNILVTVSRRLNQSIYDVFVSLNTIGQKLNASSPLTPADNDFISSLGLGREEGLKLAQSIPGINAQAAAATNQESTAPVGGIDLNPRLLDLQIRRDNTGVPLPFNQQPFENMNIDGFIPVIINVSPVTNLPLLLGLKDDNQENVVDHETQEDPLKLSYATKIDAFKLNESID